VVVPATVKQTLKRKVGYGAEEDVNVSETRKRLENMMVEDK
jgi:hypothetical protein